MPRNFKWQINASDVSKVIGVFQKYQQEALAKTWKKNLKRMPRFGVRPSTNFKTELYNRNKTMTTEESVEHKLEAPEMKKIVDQAVAGSTTQTEAIQHIQEKANAEVSELKQKLRTSQKEITQLRTSMSKKTVLKNYITVKSGIKRTKLFGCFSVKNTRIYLKTSRAKAKKISQDQADARGWILPHKSEAFATNMEKREQQCANLQKTVEQAVEVKRTIKKVAEQRIQTTKGINAENTDLKQVQKKAPATMAGNTKSYFYHIHGNPYGAFIIGKIDGFDPETKTVIELKHRARGLFNRLRDYEKVQCFIYMKMLKVKKAKLIETYQGVQKEYNIEWDEDFWATIFKGLLKAIRTLNRAEVDKNLRNEWIEYLM